MKYLFVIAILFVSSLLTLSVIGANRVPPMCPCTCGCSVDVLCNKCGTCCSESKCPCKCGCGETGVCTCAK